MMLSSLLTDEALHVLHGEERLCLDAEILVHINLDGISNNLHSLGDVLQGESALRIVRSIVGGLGISFTLFLLVTIVLIVLVLKELGEITGLHSGVVVAILLSDFISIGLCHVQELNTGELTVVNSRLNLGVLLQEVDEHIVRVLALEGNMVRNSGLIRDELGVGHTFNELHTSIADAFLGKEGLQLGESVAFNIIEHGELAILGRLIDGNLSFHFLIRLFISVLTVSCPYFLYRSDGSFAP